MTCRSGAMRLRFLAVTCSLPLCVACAATTRTPVPAQLGPVAGIVGLEDVRLLVGLASDASTTRRFLSDWEPRGDDGIISILTLSGGGEKGAFGAGLLCGWTESGKRPDFDVVTGISTGSLVGVFAFLGPTYDDVLRSSYTETTHHDIFSKRSFFGILRRRDAVMSSKPLAAMISATVTPDVLAGLAREHERGRRLYVGTTLLDTQSGVIWDVGAIAASGRPEALGLVRRILLASASIPVAFPPVLFDVEANGELYQEVHVDGGIIAQAFGAELLPMQAERFSPGTSVRLYFLLNGRITPEYRPAQLKLGDLARKSLATMIKVQGKNDLLRAYVASRLVEAEFYAIAIPEDFAVEPTGPFDPIFMNALFERGFELGRSDIPWMRSYPARPEAEREP